MACLLDPSAKFPKYIKADQGRAWFSQVQQCTARDNKVQRCFITDAALSIVCAEEECMFYFGDVRCRGYVAALCAPPILFLAFTSVPLVKASGGTISCCPPLFCFLLAFTSSWFSLQLLILRMIAHWTEWEHHTHNDIGSSPRKNTPTPYNTV